MDKELGSVHSMFNVPIVHYPIENWSVNKKKILDALPPEDETQVAHNHTGLYTDFFSNSNADQDLPSYFPTVLNVIGPYLKNFMDSNPVEFTGMWYQKYYQGVEHTTHCHGFNGWSSIIYVEFDPKVHESTMFYSPFTGLSPNGNVETCQINIKEGDMVLFPSSILHDAPLNRSDTRRTVVSYNLRGHVDTVKHVELWDDKK